MFEKFLSANVENFRQRYEGTFGFYKDGGKNRLLVKLTGISAQSCDFVDARGVTFSIRPDHPDNVGFEFLPPKSQWYNTKAGATYTQRIAHRQFQRGVTTKTLEAFLLKNGQLAQRQINFPTLSDVYENSMSPKDAVKQLDEDKSFALSGQFAMGSGAILLLKETIGTYSRSGGDFKIKLNEPDLWRVEISDAIKAVGCTADIS